jgi:hypothetical protein
MYDNHHNKHNPIYTIKIPVIYTRTKLERGRVFSITANYAIENK